jgi:hypothetical protein
MSLEHSPERLGFFSAFTSGLSKVGVFSSSRRQLLLPLLLILLSVLLIGWLSRLIPTLEVGSAFQISVTECAALAAARLDRAAWSIVEFCERNGLSRSMFYRLKRLGIGPRIMTVGERQLISVAAEREWQLEREQAAYEPRRRDEAIEKSVEARAKKKAELQAT